MTRANPAGAPEPCIDAIIDVTRIWGRAGAQAPTGIDRVELAYARHFMAFENTQFVRRSRTGKVIVVPRRDVAMVIAKSDERWAQTGSPTGELERIEDRVRRGFGERDRLAVDGLTSRSDGLMRSMKLRGAVLTAGSMQYAGPTGHGRSIYFHVSHQGLDDPARFRWLDGKPIKRVVACHDLIPITHPEYCQPGARVKHERRIATMAKLADAIFVISQTTGRDLSAHLRDRGLREPPVIVVPLGLNSRWCVHNASPSSDIEEPAPVRPTFRTPVPYFLCVGTIEGRKNHAFLLTLWRDLVREHGNDAPVLLVVGSRGWEAQTACAMLDRCEGFDGHVLELGSVSDPALKALMENASALLSPSFAEGFSYPPVEAMTLGCPLIVSDIGAHREYLGPRTTYLDPTDGQGWKAAVMAHAKAREDTRGQEVDRPDLSWDTHFSRLLDGLKGAGVVG